MTLGEECIILHTFHVNEDPDQPRCTLCWDDDYKQTGKYDCPNCYGTTFEGGIKEEWRAWGLFTSNIQGETKAKRGEWELDARRVQLEASPDMGEHDFIIRVLQWDNDLHAPLVLGGRYVMGPVEEDTLHTGNQYAQQDDDKIGQKANITLLSTEHPLYLYQITLGERLYREDEIYLISDYLYGDGTYTDGPYGGWSGQGPAPEGEEPYGESGFGFGPYGGLD